MGTFFKENWFKMGFIIILAFSITYYLYLVTKEHNLNVVNSARLCANLDGESVGDCAEAVKRQHIPTIESWGN